MSPSSRRVILVLALASLTISSLAAAQGGGGGGGEAPKNLQVLPKNMSRAEVFGVMRRFTSALGLRCNDCHVVTNPGQQPERLDPSLDDKELKKVARVMLRMTMDINGKYLTETGRTFTPLTRVTCETCHHGTSKPRTLAAELLGAMEAKGGDSAVVRYRELRDKTYGRAMFDFGEASLPDVADEATRAKRPDDAMKLLELNLEFFPKSGMTYGALAMEQVQRGDTAAARATVQKGLAAAPDSPQLMRIQSMLNGERPRP
jgi:hypothetical protein